MVIKSHDRSTEFATNRFRTRKRHDEYGLGVRIGPRWRTLTTVDVPFELDSSAFNDDRFGVGRWRRGESRLAVLCFAVVYARAHNGVVFKSRVSCVEKTARRTFHNANRNVASRNNCCSSCVKYYTYILATGGKTIFAHLYCSRGG